MLQGALSRLIVGDRTVSRCEDGVLVAEYALFDGASWTVVCEEGYARVTTAGAARTRLEAAGITPELAHAALKAVRADHLIALATSPDVIRVLDELGPYEIFEGGTFVASSGRYLGTWLDLDALGDATSRHVALLTQVIHLLAVVDEVAEDVPVRLVTPERGWREVHLEAAQDLPSLLHAMPVPQGPRPIRDEAEVRESLLRDLRARAAASEKSRTRLHKLASHLAAMGRSDPPGPSEAPDTTRDGAVNGGAAASALSPDPWLLFEEFRQRSQGLQGEAHVRATAQFLASMANRPSAFPEFSVLAARAWLAAGDREQAERFAKRLVEDPAASDGARLTALEILDRTSRSVSFRRPPPPPPVPADTQPPLSPIAPAPIVVISTPPPPPPPDEHAAVVVVPATPAVFVEPAPQPARIVAPSTSSPRRYVRAEVVESLSLPEGLDDAMLPPGTLPTDVVQVRIAMTRLAREVGRDYRQLYGTVLKTDVLAIDAMQRHLRARSPGEAQVRELEMDLLRHGALLSEILARRLGAEWVDLGAAHPAEWSMVLATEEGSGRGTSPDPRFCPIGRVYRFFRHGHHESDLVAFYLDLETCAKSQ
jgi:hypothetical protein